MFPECPNRLHYFFFDFLRRHSWGSSDVLVLRGKYPQVEFKGIPDAWILALDDMVQDILLVNRDAVLDVRQEYGFLSVRFLSDDDLFDYQPIIHSAEKDLYLLDADLHRELEYHEWWTNAD